MILTSEEYSRQWIVSDFGGSTASRIAQKAWAGLSGAFRGIRNEREPGGTWLKPGRIGLLLVAAAVAAGYPSRTQESAPGFSYETAATPSRVPLRARALSAETQIAAPLTVGDLEGAPGFTGLNEELAEGDLGEIPNEELSESGSYQTIDLNAAVSVPSEGRTLMPTQDGGAVWVYPNGSIENATQEEAASLNQ